MGKKVTVQCAALAVRDAFLHNQSQLNQGNQDELSPLTSTNWLAEGNLLTDTARKLFTDVSKSKIYLGTLLLTVQKLMTEKATAEGNTTPTNEAVASRLFPCAIGCPSLRQLHRYKSLAGAACIAPQLAQYVPWSWAEKAEDVVLLAYGSLNAAGRSAALKGDWLPTAAAPSRKDLADARARHVAKPSGMTLRRVAKRPGQSPTATTNHDNTSKRPRRSSTRVRQTRSDGNVDADFVQSHGGFDQHDVANAMIACAAMLTLLAPTSASDPPSWNDLEKLWKCQINDRLPSIVTLIDSHGFVAQLRPTDNDALKGATKYMNACRNAAPESQVPIFDSPGHHAQSKRRTDSVTETSRDEFEKEIWQIITPILLSQGIDVQQQWEIITSCIVSLAGGKTQLVHQDFTCYQIALSLATTGAYLRRLCAATVLMCSNHTANLTVQRRFYIIQEACLIL